MPIKSFGKRHLEDVQPEVTTQESVANWCSVDTRTGSLAITLEENTCFDAEMYADDLDLDIDIEFKEDQRSERMTVVLMTRRFADYGPQSIWVNGSYGICLQASSRRKFNGTKCIGNSY